MATRIDPYQAESDFHALRRAAEVKSDPVRHARAKAHGRKMIDTAKKAIGMPGKKLSKPDDAKLLGQGYSTSPGF